MDFNFDPRTEMRPETRFGIPVATADPRLSGDGQREQISRWSEQWLRLKRGTVRRPAAVFDIDETLLSKGANIPSICALFDACRHSRITCFIVTARNERHKSETEDALASIGVHGYRDVYMMQVEDGTRITPTYMASSKLRWREAIARRGYTIVLNAGDAWTDHGLPHEAQIRMLRDALDDQAAHAYITDDGVLHLKLQSAA